MLYANRRSGLLLVAFYCFCAPVMAAPVDAGASTDWRAAARDAVVRASHWLKDQQREDGSFSNDNYPAMTALPMWALAVSEPAATTAVARAAACVLGYVKPDGGIYKDVLIGGLGGGLGTYNTAVCMSALHVVDARAYRQQILDARRYVAGNQVQGESGNAGGFGYGKPRKHPVGFWGGADLNNTAMAAQAMRMTESVEEFRPQGEARVDIDWDAVQSYVTRLQAGDRPSDPNSGGFSYKEKPPKPDKEGAVPLYTFGSMTYAGLLSLIYADVDRNDPRVKSALGWARRHWDVSENPGAGARGLFYYYNVLAKAMATTGVAMIPTEKGAIDWREAAARAIVKNLRPVEGNPTQAYWVNDDNRYWEGDAVLVTSYSLIALNHILRDQPDAGPPSE